MLKKKSQVAIEFMVLVSIGFVFLLIATAFMGGEFKETSSRKQITLVRDVAFSVQNEINLAAQVEMGYYRTFETPETLDGIEYTIENSRKQVIVRTENYDFAVTIPEVRGSVTRGANLIRRLNGYICLGDVACYDDTPPIITFKSPSGVQTTEKVRMNVTTDEDTTCKYSLADEDYFNMRKFFSGENTTHTVVVGPLADGSYTYYVRCKDWAGNPMNYSSTINFQVIVPDTDPPIVTLLTPSDGLKTPNITTTFQYTVYDVKSNISNCELVINNIDNKTSSSILEYQTNSFSTNLSNGVYTWNINCTDNSTFSNEGISSIRTITVDYDSPVVTSILPENNNVTNATTVVFIYNVTDALSVHNCSLIINSSINITDTTISEHINQNFTVNLTDTNSTYVWNINCTDELGNTGTSELRNLTVSI